jgi:hypothetical protein
MPRSLADLGVRRDASQRGTPLAALFISRSVRGRLRAGPFTGRVFAVFERACNLVAPGGNLIALVLPQVGDGPLNIVVDGGLDAFDGIEPGIPVWMEANRLRIGGLLVTLDRASIWEPCPDWDGLRDSLNTIQSRLSLLESLALDFAPEGSLLSPLPGQRPAAPCVSHSAADGVASGAALARAHDGAEILRMGWRGDVAQLRVGAAHLAGLGGGLTPAGDDFLIGAMLWAWLAHPDPRQACRRIVEAAASRTTILSAAFLRAAAEGECSAPWHRLLAALGSGDENLLGQAVQQVLAQGSTSGADTLAGFLWLGLSGMRP